MRAAFDTAEYDTVIHAFRARTALSLEGHLFPVGQRYELRNPRNLSVEPDVDDEGPIGEAGDLLGG